MTDFDELDEGVESETDSDKSCTTSNDSGNELDSSDSELRSVGSQMDLSLSDDFLFTSRDGTKWFAQSQSSDLDLDIGEHLASTTAYSNEATTLSGTQLITTVNSFTTIS